MIWLEIVTKRYDEFCHKISRSSLPLNKDPMDIIFQHRLRLGSLYFCNEKVCNFDILFCFLYKIYSCYCLLAYNSGTTTHMAECYHTIMHLPFVNLGAKSQPNSSNAHRLKHFVYSILQTGFR